MTVLVIGATGELGARVVPALAGRGIDVRAMTRRAEAPALDRDASAGPTHSDLGRAGRIDVAHADLREPGSLGAAFAGVRGLFLVSSPAVDQVELETNAIDAAEHAGVEHIVKVSNLPIAGLETGLHGNHRAVERRLDVSPIPATVLQPSFFASVFRRQLGLLRRGRVVLPIGAGHIAWIDPRDIADVAAALLAEPVPEVAPAASPRPAGARVLRLTGPDALDAPELASRLSEAIGSRIEVVQPPLDRWRSDLVASGLDPWLAESTVHLYEAVARGALAGVSPDVERVLGRAPRSIDAFLTELLVPLLGE